MLTEFFSQAIIYTFAGAFAGLMSGLMGIGGGIIVVPALLIIFQHTSAISPALIMQMAVGSSLAIMIFTSLAAIRAHSKLDTILWPVFRRIIVGIAVGTLLGSLLAAYIPTEWLKRIFLAFLLFIAFKMVFERDVIHQERFPGGVVNALISLFIGLLSGLLGIGGGLLIIPYLGYCGVAVRKTAAITSLCTLVVSILGTVTYTITGADKAGLPPYSMGYVYWLAVLFVAIPSSLFAPLGARLSYNLPLKQLRYGFIAILLITAFNLL